MIAMFLNSISVLSGPPRHAPDVAGQGGPVISGAGATVGFVLWWVAWALSAHAGEPIAARTIPSSAYERAVDLIGSLYLHPERTDPVRLLQAAGDGLSTELDWLVVTPVEHGIDLSHGNGRPIGSVTVASLETLPDALRALEATVLEAGYPVGEVNVRLALLEGMCGALDRYSTVMAGEKAARFDVRLKGTVVGIGVEIDALDGDAMRVERVTRGSPAEAAGVLPGDVLLRIDGRSTTNLPNSEAGELIQGDEGTVVSLVLQRGASTLTFSITRAEIVVPNVASRVLPGGAGYVSISHVSQRTVENLVSALEELKSAGALSKGLVIDVRGNTGGSMKESAYVADQFVQSGLLLETVGRNGSEVPNLQRRMDATDADSVVETGVPIAILVDDHTASGAEIVAGSLLELDRAVLVGERTYGKGTVQKIFDLDDKGTAELKLTVAEYLLANDTHIADKGLVPDATVGRIALDATGVRYNGWDPWRQGVGWDEIIPEVVEHASWRGTEDGDRDVALELARRTVLAARGGTREAAMTALSATVAAVRQEEDVRLVTALGAKGIDWSAAEADGPLPAAEVRVSAVPQRGDGLLVTASVENLGTTTLHRALVELSGPSVWSGLVIPVGLVGPSATATGALSVRVPPGIDLREDEVGTKLRSDKRPMLDGGTAILRHGSTPIPRVEISAKLVALGPDTARAEITVHNLAQSTLSGLDARFAYPEDARIDLVDASSSISAIGPLKSHLFGLDLKVGEDAPPVLPLEVVLETSTLGELLHWPLSLPRDGSEVVLESPTIQVKKPILSAASGIFQLPVLVADDHGLDHVVVWVNGDKSQWIDGGGTEVGFDARVRIAPGGNHVTVVATDDQGLQSRRTFVIRGEGPDPAVDASP
jgi:C-terminal peptidase prc